MKNDFEAMVERYSKELLSQRQKWKSDGYIKDEPSADDKSAAVSSADVGADVAAERQGVQEALITAEDELLPDDTDSEAVAQDAAPEMNTEIPMDSSLFYARVFTGDNAYPLKGAKVVLRRDGQLVSFTVTDKNGETPKVKIPAFPKENSLEPMSDNQSLEYFADVYMNGFTTKKDLLISAVGGSVAVLDVQMTPIAERID